MVYYVDIDETICRYEGERNYPDAVPIKDNIKKINSLYDEGHTVVYWTARGSVTKINWRDLTKRQLDNWGAKHTELRLGKPHYDLFICDKVINTEDFFSD
tara:strand:- start:197 stop:496 length:300 start_codon:yes stop_codon:yes gene_type:complete